MTISVEQASKMYPVWHWLKISEEELRFRARNWPSACAVVGCEREPRGQQTLCPGHMGAYRKKRAQVIQSMGA